MLLHETAGLAPSWQADDVRDEFGVSKRCLCTWFSVEASGREEWKRSGGRAGSLLERCLPSPGVLSLRKEVVVDSLVQQWVRVCSNRWRLAEGGVAQMPAGYFCTWSSVKASGREEWKRSGGRAGSLGERCLPSPGVLSPYKEIVGDPVAHRCACDPPWKLVGRHECRGELCLRSSEARPHVRVSDATTCAIPQLCAEAPSTVLWLP